MLQTEKDFVFAIVFIGFALGFYSIGRLVIFLARRIGYALRGAPPPAPAPVRAPGPNALPVPPPPAAPKLPWFPVVFLCFIAFSWGALRYLHERLSQDKPLISSLDPDKTARTLWALPPADAPSGVRDPVLWAGARAGMSRFQVWRTVPGIRLNFQGSNPDGTDAALRLEGIELSGSPYTARFVFKDGQLFQVVVTPPEILPPDEAADRHESLRRAMTLHYGFPDAEPPFGNVWRAGSTQFRLLFINNGPGDPVANLALQVNRRPD